MVSSILRQLRTARATSFEKTGCTVSVGVGRNILLAKLATSVAKPNGIHCLMNIRTDLSTISDMHVKKIPGVGSSIAKQLKNFNVEKIGDLRLFACSQLQDMIGKVKGEMLFKAFQGLDDTKIQISHVRKSVGSEINWGIRFLENLQVEKFIGELCREVVTRLFKASGFTIEEIRMLLKLNEEAFDKFYDPKLLCAKTITFKIKLKT